MLSALPNMWELPFWMRVAAVLLLPGATSLVLSLGGVYWLRGWLLARQQLDIPNERSNHSTPTPRGAGLAVMIVILAGWWMMPSLYAWTYKPMMMEGYGAIGFGLMGLTALSWCDDRHSLPAYVRLLGHLCAVVAGVMAFDGPILRPLHAHGLPLWLDHALAGFLWLWFINLFNFMDGIDEISATQSLAILLGFFMLTMFGDMDRAHLLYAGWCGGAILGFWWWNRHPAKIFLGDSGSIPLGFLLGFFLLTLCANGYWHIAAILPAYYMLDATYTLLRRMLRGEKFWQAHSTHAYQRAVRSGKTPPHVCRMVALCALLGYGWVSASFLWPDVPRILWVMGSYACAGGIMVYLVRFTVNRKPAEPRHG